MDIRKIVWLMILLAATWSCSSSQEGDSDSENGDEVTEVSDAGTDPVPEDPMSDLDPTKDESPVADTPPAPPPEEEPSPLSTETPAEQPLAAAEPLPAEPPAPEQAAPPPSSDSFAGGELSDYEVKQGDTLMRIAYETYGDLYQWRKIYNSNKDKISDPNNVAPGTVIKLERPAQPFSAEGRGEKYQIEKGDTLGKISNKFYGTPSKWKQLLENNRQMIKDPNKIYAGFYLYYIPDDGSVSPQQLGKSPSEHLEGGDALDTSSNAQPSGMSPQAAAAPGAESPAASPPAQERAPASQQ
jgi:nucleoid-associated protein YgaU